MNASVLEIMVHPCHVARDRYEEMCECEHEIDEVNQQCEICGADFWAIQARARFIGERARIAEAKRKFSN